MPRRIRYYPQQGGNIFTSIYEKVLKPVGSFVKKNKLISTGLSLIPHPGAKVGAVVASQLGLGRRKRRVGRRRQRGRGMGSAGLRINI